MPPVQSCRALSIAALLLGLCGCSDKLLSVTGAIVVNPTRLDFGSTTVGTPKALPVQISNTGSTVLTIVAITIPSNPNGDLALTGLDLRQGCNGQARANGTALSPGECVVIGTTWTPTSMHAAAGAVEIASNDPQHPAILLPVTGTVASEPTCDPVCGAGQACCNLACVDSQSDPAHCGGCAACEQGQTCTAGLCTTPQSSSGCDDQTAPCSGAATCCNHICTAPGSGGACPCTPAGASNFAAGSIIVPMDYCWQRGIEVDSIPGYCTRNFKVSQDDAPLKAYGLLYFLLRHKVTVFVAIDEAKPSIDGIDLSLVSAAAPPVQRYDWSSHQAVALGDLSQTRVDYRGGPFLIDASQHDRVLALLANDPDFQQFRDAATIDIHIATVGFQSTIVQTLKAVPSRIALLQPPATASGLASAEQILVNYLDSAGLNFAGAGGTANAPGAIYDILQESDFLPNYAGSKLKSNGYRLLWAPHWEGGSSSANTSAELATIADYVNSGGDLFAECAAIGTLEGLSGSSVAAAPLMTTHGITADTLDFNPGSGTVDGPFNYAGLASPYAQRGDFTFVGFSGAIYDYHPTTNQSAYRPGVVQEITGTAGGHDSNVMTSLDQRAQGHGTIVYLAGHDYSYADNGATSSGGGALNPTEGVTAGSRLVLNTLFSLGTNNTCAP